MRKGLLFVLADGGRARFVERDVETGAFVTLEAIDNAASLRRLRRELRASPPARTFNSVGRLRHAVGREDYLRPAKEAFVATVASRAVELVRRRGLQGVVLAAPPQLIGPLRRRFRDGLVALVARTIGKDLTREPDHALDTWFERLGRGRLLGPLTGYSS